MGSAEQNKFRKFVAAAVQLLTQKLELEAVQPCHRIPVVKILSIVRALNLQAAGIDEDGETSWLHQSTCLGHTCMHAKTHVPA